MFSANDLKLKGILSFISWSNNNLGLLQLFHHVSQKSKPELSNMFVQ